ncbi:TolC family protein [Leptotrichia sp. oral taxon 879]|uniref:TolC family protein n=1 Tax=Leptotrichia sp. oral taxon 879 TaxID=1227267 RepID=UPI0003AE67FD|nr:TolC family protein [Leptotrichia sp. oral taxon 879]ERK51226.1 outer membrane efflux protein [Leptotrichia sp. oral taxon 879 str. F0557]
MKKNGNKVVVTVLLLLMSIPNFAQKITIQEAAEMAVKNNKDIKIGMMEVDREQIDVNKSWKQRFFKVSYNASANTHFKDVILKRTGESYQQYLSLSQPLFTGGKLKMGNEISKDNLKLAELKLEKTKKETVLSTVQAYIDVYEAISTLGVLQKSKEALDENYKIQTEKYNLRMVTKPEYREAERSVKDMEAQIVQQQGNIEIAKESLGILIGISNPSNIEIVPFGVEDNFTKSIDLKKDMEKLTTQNTEYKIAQKQIDISRKNTKLEKSSFYPTINGTINYGSLNSANRLKDVFRVRDFSSAAGVTFSWDIFDWGKRKEDVKYAKKTEEIAEVKSEQTLDQVRANMRKTYYQLQALEKSLEALKVAVESAEETYELEKERYSYNLITMNNLLDAEAKLRQSRVNYATSKLKYYYLVSQYGAFLD